MPAPIKVYQYDLNGKFINEFESINYAAKKTGCSFSGIKNCANKTYSYSCGFVWRFFKRKKIYPEFKSKYESMRSRFKRIQAVKGKRTLIFESISEAAKFIGCHRSAISQAISPDYSIKTVKGWKVKSLH